MSETRSYSPSWPEQELIVGMDSALPRTLAAGTGTWLYLSGWCFHPVESIRKLEVVVDNASYPVMAHSIFRPDVSRRHATQREAMTNSSYSGFWALVPIYADQVKRGVVIDLHAQLKNGKQLNAKLTTIDLLIDHSSAPPKREPEREHNRSRSDLPLIAICLATHNPPPRLFRKQIESIINQSHQNWICIISDDASSPESEREIERIAGSDRRFIFSRTPTRLGFYRNFERALSLVPEDADFIALSDHDDYWYPDKLQTLVSRFDQETLLVYSDMRIVDENGEVLSDTYWTIRRNNYTNIGSLLLTNTITGAASMFPRYLLRYVLPFPTGCGNIYHDHWIASVALSLGKIGYVDRPLYDYVQHSANILGHTSSPRSPLYKQLYHIFVNLRDKQGRKYARQVYFEHVVRIMTLARMAILRCGRNLRSGDLKTLQRLADLDSSPISCAWLVQRGLKDGRQMSVTIGTEYFLLMGIAWKIYITLMSRIGLASRYDSD